MGDFLEQHILKRREAEVKRLSYWSETSQYYDKLSKNAERYNGLASEETRRQSLEAANKEELGRQKKANLSIKRERQGMLASRLLQQQLKEKQEIEEEKKREEEEHHKRAIEEEQRKIREAQKEEERRQEKLR